MSAALASGTVATTSSVWGEITSMVRVPADGTHAPPTKIVSLFMLASFPLPEMRTV